MLSPYETKLVLDEGIRNGVAWHATRRALAEYIQKHSRKREGSYQVLFSRLRFTPVPSPPQPMPQPAPESSGRCRMRG
jgi:hypothetical protein